MVQRWVVLLLLLLACGTGCTRTRYRLLADRDSYTILRNKAEGMPWAPPSDFTLHPPPTSRLYDPTPLDDPWLPWPAPQLYSYELPDLPRRTQSPASVSPESVPPGSSPTTPGPDGAAVPEVIVDESVARRHPGSRPIRLPPVGEPPPSAVFASYLASPGTTGHRGDSVIRIPAELPATERLPSPQEPRSASRVAAAGRFTVPTSFQQAAPSQGVPGSGSRARSAWSGSAMEETSNVDVLLTQIPPDAWEAVPENCLYRMFEFTKLREEYVRSIGREPSPDQFAPGKRLTLDEIVTLTLLNSRDYQTQKELLYRTCLDLTLQRFAYQLKFSRLGSRTSPNWNHNRTGGVTVNTLSVPTTFLFDQALATGGDLAARFANSVVLTFNGPQGFAADVGSDLFIDLNQTIFQRDIRFEALTQAERNVIYGARDFTRFRKSLFVQLASQYYSLIRTYRQVEIDSQNYFTFVRAFRQSRAEYRLGRLPRIQLDQVEQQVLAGRSRLIGTCNTLETLLDSLKLRIGLPTETHINIELAELEQLTKRDELAVTGELIRRVRQRVSDERSEEEPNRVVLISSSIVLIERMLESLKIQKELGLPASQQEPALLEQLLRLRVEGGRESAEQVRGELDKELRTQPPSPLVVFQRTMDLIDSLLELTEQQFELATLLDTPPDVLEPLRRRMIELHQRTDLTHDNFARLIDEGRIGELPQIVQLATQLKNDLDTASAEMDRALGVPTERPTPQAAMRRSLEDADRLLELSRIMIEGLDAGLIPVEIEVDDAMLTAINLRFDLMNQRGDLADTWRQVKYAGDNLKSILNINANHTLRTRSGFNRPFDFTFDDSNTTVRATFDAPFNRRAERNNYRAALINYQAALRQLMLLEDNVKFAVRNDLRSLTLDKAQYPIEVASAALAYERVISVMLELRFGIGNVQVRDFLEAQNSYASSLSSVAGRHIGYIVNRTQLFLDMELLTVGDDGFWNELYDERYQPAPYYQLPFYGEPVYGSLVPGLWYSHLIRRQEQVPPGEAGVHRSDNPQGGSEELPGEPPAPLPPPVNAPQTDE